VPDSLWTKYRRRGLDETLSAVYGMVENLDTNIRRVLSTIDELDLRDDTIVVFLTDNGPNSDRFNGYMREHKGSVHDGGVRVPLFIRWPGHISSGRVVTDIAAHIDLLPTLADLAGVPLPAGRQLDGRSLRPVLEADAIQWPERLIFTHRFGSGRVTRSPGSVRSVRWRAVSTGHGWQLFDVQSDPGERVDVSSREPEVTARLAASFESWFDDVTSAGFDPIPAEVGHPLRPRVILPAHEATLHPQAGEGIDYFGGQGWANDWISRWSDPTAFASWSVNVVEPGEFDVGLLYTCPVDDAGSRIRIQIGNSAVVAIVTEPYDPPALPSPDRVRRHEVYEKEWKELAAGRLTLARGTTTLYVRADSIAGRTAMDLKAVSLRKRAD
jgi:arylsulfatase A